MIDKPSPEAMEAAQHFTCCVCAEDKKPRNIHDDAHYDYCDTPKLARAFDAFAAQAVASEREWMRDVINEWEPRPGGPERGVMDAAAIAGVECCQQCRGTNLHASGDCWDCNPPPQDERL